MINELSIIIPTLNEEKYLPILLTSIMHNKSALSKLEIIIVDGHSEDKTIITAEKFKKHFQNLSIITAKRNLPAQRNAGAKLAKYKYLLFLDADVILPKELFKNTFKKINTQEEFACTVME